MSMFANHFWGEKHIGFEVLSQNLKHGEQSCRDLEDFLKQCSNLEDQYVKSLARLVKNVGTYSTHSSFSPVWQAVKSSLEKISSAHTDLSKRWQELTKDVHKYLEGLSKKYKTFVKDTHSSTLETVQSMQAITAQLTKSKETYNSKFSDYKKLLSDKATVKKIEKSEADFKKATEDYKATVTKYNTTVDDFKKKMDESTESFQENEVEYLSQLESFVQKYASIREEKHTEIGELYYEFHSKHSELSVESLLQVYIEGSGTGDSPPEHVEFEEADVASLPPPPSPPEEGVLENTNKPSSEASTPTQNTSSMIHLNITGIFRRKNRKKKAGKDTDSAADADSMDKVSNASNTSQPEVDEEGYIIRKEKPTKDDYSDSSSDSDSDADERRKSKFKVEIKPLGTPNSLGDSSGANMSNDDLLDLFGKPMSPKTPSENSRGTTPISWNNVPVSDGSLTAEDREVFNSWKGANQNSSSSNPSATSGSAAFPGLPRPPSRKDISSGRLSSTGRISPMSSMMTKHDSFSQQTIHTFSTNHNSADMIPIAVALTENIMSKVRGSDHETQVGGNVMMSFPVEVLSVEELPQLSFKIAGRSPEQIRVNTDLITSQGDIHTFKESVLLSALKAKKANNPSAKHHNLEVARYTLSITCLPLNLKAYWKCEPDLTDFRLDYEYVGSALSKPLPLTNMKFLVPVNGGVSTLQSMPEGIWSSDHQKVLWKLDELKSGSDSKGSLRARFNLTEGPSTPASVDVQFICDGAILSGTEFELTNTRYKVSFTRKRMLGKFLVDTDKLVTYV